MPLPTAQTGALACAALLGALACVAGCSRDKDAPGRAPKSQVAAASSIKSAPSVAEVAVFDFSANALQAHHFVHGGLLVNADEPSIAKYVPFTRKPGWQLARADGGAVPVAKRSRLRLDLPALPEARLELSLTAQSAQQLSLLVDGRSVLSERVARGQHHLVTRLGAVSGEVELELRSRGRGLVLHSLWVGPAAAPAIDARTAHVDGEIQLDADEELLYYLHVPTASVVRGRVVGDCPVQLEVRGSQSLGGLVDEGGVSLARMAGEVVTARLSARDCPRAVVRDLRIVVPEQPTKERRSRGRAPRHVLLWVMDTLRADRVRVVDPDAPAEVPALERLARGGAVFTQAYVQGNESQTSHASLFTGTYPAVHGVRSAGDGGRWNIPRALSTLGQELSSAGMTVVGVTGNGMVTADAGYGRGFAKFVNMMRADDPQRRNGWIPARKIAGSAMALFEPLASRPSALFIGTIDNHKPYVGHQPWLDQLHPQPYRGPFERAAWPRDLGIVRGSMKCDAELSDRDLTRIIAIYDSNISYQDQSLGAVLDRLEELGILEETLVIVTADHGEELWEDGRCGHGASSRDSLVHVPLVISYPPALAQGVVIEEGVDVADVFPTVLELVGRAPPQGVQAESLVPLINGEVDDYPRPSYASQYEYAHVMRIGRWKLRVGPTGSFNFYDLDEEPVETNDAAADHPREYAYLRDSLLLFLSYRKHWRKALWGTANRLTRDGAAALRELEKGEDAGLGR